MTVHETSCLLGEKAYPRHRKNTTVRRTTKTKRKKTRTIEIGDGDIVFVEVPAYRLPTLQQLSGTTFSIKLYPLK